MKDLIQKIRNWSDNMYDKFVKLNLRRPIYGWIAVFALIVVMCILMDMCIYYPMMIDDTLINYASNAEPTSLTWCCTVGLLFPFMTFYVTSLGLIQEHQQWLIKIRKENEVVE